MTRESTPDTGRSRIARLVPLVWWVRRYERPWLRLDVIAGLAVGGLVIPKALGYAGIAGVPVQYGLYAAAAGTILYALFGTSRQISTGPSAALATLAGGAVLAAGASGQDAVQMAASVTFVSGILLLVMAVFRMGWISQFLSRAVIIGFLFGAGIQTAIGELGGITGSPESGSNSWEKLGSWISNLSEANRTTFIVGLISLAVVFGVRYVAPRVPGALVLLVGGLLASTILDLAERGVAMVGEVPKGLPALVLPSFSYMGDHYLVVLAAAIGLVLIGFSQTAGDARSFAARHRYRVDINQECVAQGMSNVGSGLLQGIPVSTSLSASSLNDHTGAKTPVSSLVTGALIVLTMLFLAPLFSNLPKPVLSALIIEAVIMGMVDVAAMRRLRRVKRSDFWIAVAAILAVLSSGVLAGVVIGIALSIGWLVYVSISPNMPLLGRETGTQVFRDLAEHPDGEKYPGLVVLGFDAGLFFIDADSLEDRLTDLIQADSGLHTVVVSFEGVNYIDSQGSEKLGQILEVAHDYGVELRLARVKPRVMQVLRRDGIIERLGETAIYGNLYEATKDRIPPAGQTLAGGIPGPGGTLSTAPRSESDGGGFSRHSGERS